MPPILAAAVFALGILFLFWLDREPGERTSAALWLPTIWIFLAGSRMVSQWIRSEPLSAANSADMYLEGNPVDRNVLSGLVLLALVVLISRGPKLVRLLRANWALLLFFAYGLMSVSWSDYPDVAFKRWIKALGDLAMVLIVLTDRDRTAAIKQLLARLGFLLMPISILLIKYYGDLGRVYDPAFGHWIPMYTGATTTKNLLGMITLICGLGALWRLIQEYRKGRKVRKQRVLLAQLVLLGMVLWLFKMANSMTSIACFAMASGLMIATSIPRLNRTRTLMHVMLGTVLLVAVSALFLDAAGGVLQSLGRDPTLTGRTEVWKLVLSETGNPIVGTGFESFWLGPRLERMWRIYWWHPNEAHNGYLEVYLNLGWIGVTLLALLIVAAYRSLSLAFRKDREVACLRLAFFATALTYNLTESAFRMMHPVWIVFLLAAVTVPQSKLRAKPKETHPAIPTGEPVPVLERV